MATRMQQRRGTASQWTTANPILATGEIGFETDTNQFKIGDGTNHWDDLSYFKNLEDLGGSLDDYVLIADLGAPGSAASLDVNGYIPVNQLGNILGDAPQILDTLEELAGALQDADGLVTIKINTKADAERVITTSDINTAITAEQTARSEEINSVIDTQLTQARSEITSEIGDAIGDEALNRNNAITTAINEEILNRDNAIADSASSVTGTLQTFATDAAADAQAAAETSAQGYVSTHNSDTTNVHGIADTSELATITQVSSAAANAISSAATSVDNKIGDNTVDGSTGNTVTARIATAQTAAESYADSAVETHNDDTTSVHGIADTSKLVTTDATATTLDGSLTIEGDLTVNGTNFAASATTITIEDNIVQLAHSNAANTVDLGLVVAYNDGAAKHSGVVRDVSADAWKIFKGVTTEPTTTVAFGEGSLDNLHVNNLTAAGVIFTDGTQTKQGVPSITDVVGVTTNNGAFDTAPLERDMLIQYTESFAGELTILPDSLKNFPVGSSFDVLQVGTGQLTIVAGNGVTVNATPGLKLRTQWSSATIFKRAENTWVVFGDLSA
jgi:hypothetical protein